MPQVAGKPGTAAGDPGGVVPGLGALVGSVAVAAVEVEEEVDLAARGRVVVEVGGGAFDARLDDGVGASGAGPVAEEARGGGFDEDGLPGLVFDEA